MSNERYWMFHEWVRKNYILENGYELGTYDGLALVYWYLEDDGYYLQFENKYNTDEEIEMAEEEKITIWFWLI